MIDKFEQYVKKKYPIVTSVTVTNGVCVVYLVDGVDTENLISRGYIPFLVVIDRFKKYFNVEITNYLIRNSRVFNTLHIHTIKSFIRDR